MRDTEPLLFCEIIPIQAMHNFNDASLCIDGTGKDWNVKFPQALNKSTLEIQHPRVDPFAINPTLLLMVFHTIEEIAVLEAPKGPRECAIIRLFCCLRPLAVSQHWYLLRLHPSRLHPVFRALPPILQAS